MFNNRSCKNASRQLPSRQKNLILSGFILLILLSVGVLSGCADHKARTQELLAEDYHALSNDDLTLYYYKLEDQIDVVERKSRGSSISLGLGLGSFGRRSGGSGSVGVSTGASKQNVATDLRDRRNLVRLELQHRGITP